jgi:uncharacterized protein
MNIVIDTNVLLSAALRDGLPERLVLHFATRDDYRWLVTAEIVAEYIGVLRRPKFALAAEIIERWATLVAMRTVLISDPRVPMQILRDPGDAKFVAAAMAGDAEFLITGDRDLLDANLPIRTRVLTVAECAAIFGVS